MSRHLSVTVFLLACLCSLARADVRLPAVLNDHMVLQRNAEVALWGWADPGERLRVTVGWDTAVVETTADLAGRWRVALRTPGAGGPYTLTIAGKNKIALQDVLVGEVWVCSGQSNMAYSFASGVADGEQDRAEDGIGPTR